MVILEYKLTSIPEMKHKGEMTTYEQHTFDGSIEVIDLGAGELHWGPGGRSARWIRHNATEAIECRWGENSEYQE